MSKILVTGGAGFIGSHTVCELVASGHTPVIVDNFSNTDERILVGLRAILGYDPTLYKIDCTDEAAMRLVFEKEKPDAVIHFAAFKAVGESVEKPLKYYRNNLDSLLLLLQLMEEFQVNHLVFSSSCTVYGQPEKLPVTEQSPQQDATSSYGATKQMGERIIRDVYQSRKSLKSALLRYFNPIGAHNSGLIGELPFGVPSNLVPYITQTAAGIRSKLVIHGNDYETPDGTCLRDFIHVSDLARAHVKALEWLTKQEEACETFNLGQGKGNSVKEVVDTFIKVTGVPFSFEIGPRRSGDVEKVWADVTKSNTMLQWKTELSLERALEDAWRWEMQLKNSQQ
jgi:UDP-glucose 4-epimerase